MDVHRGEPPINFHLHRVRSNTAGGRHEFEQLAASLVDLVEGPARSIEPAPGDWGIDVFTGDLTSQVRIWQVKYFIDGLRKGQLDQVRKSFARACEAAVEHGYRIDRWTLCIPVTMDGPTSQAFERWRIEQRRRTGIPIKLWDETALRTLLTRPQCTGLRELYYGSSAGSSTQSSAGAVPTRLRARPDELTLDVADAPVLAWHGGLELRAAAVIYLLHDPVSQWTAPDGSWSLRDVTAYELEPGHQLVRLRHLWVHRSTPHARAGLAALRSQADLLGRLRGTPGLPDLIAHQDAADHGLLVMSAAAGRTWADIHAAPAASPVHHWAPAGGPRDVRRPDRIAAARVLGDAAALCRTLEVLHQHGQAHRQLTGDALVFPSDATARRPDRQRPSARRADGQRGPVLRDPGMVAMSGRPDDGTATDVYQLAALVLDALEGRPPGAVSATPPSTIAPAAAPAWTSPLPLPPGWGPSRGATAGPAGLPVEIADLLASACAPSPQHRPSIAELASGLWAARRALSRGDGLVPTSDATAPPTAHAHRPGPHQPGPRQPGPHQP